MPSFRFLIFLLLLLIAVCARAQDTASVFFQTGKYKLTDAAKASLDQIQKEYNLALLDSVLFIGIADSIGKVESNLKLSRKRAQAAADYCSENFPYEFKSRIVAAGEKSRKDAEFNRRVDVILYLREPDDSIVNAREVIPGTLISRCYNIDYRILHRANISSVITKKGKYTVIEIELRDLKNIKLHYYASVSKGGKISVKKLTWTMKTTGKKWWRKHRYVASIPEMDYKRFKIFQISNAPCDSCTENPFNNDSLLHETTCLQLDRFLMENIQVRVPFFKKDFVHVRAPREYVNLNDKYFIGCTGEPLVWKTRRGRRARNYFYARLPVRYNIACNIVKQVNCCLENPLYSECDKLLMSCRSYGRPDKRLMILAEAGNHYQFSEHVPYASVGLGRTGDYSFYKISAGTDIKLNLYASCKAQLNFISFPFGILNPFSRWESPSDVNVLNKFGQVYAGLELKSRTGKEDPALMESNIHFGISAVSVSRTSVFRRIFIQAGMGYDFTGNYSKTVYPILQIGADLKILAF